MSTSVRSFVFPTTSRHLAARPSPRLRRLAWLAAVSLLLSACAAEEDAAPPAGETGSTSGLQKKHPGPCQTTYLSASGKTYEEYLLYAYDAEGRLVEEKTGPGSIDVGAVIYVKKWGYNAAGELITESVAFPNKDEGNSFDWTYTYDAQGRRLTRKGTQTSYGTADCSYEYLAGKKDYNLLCTYKKSSKKGGKKSGKYTIQYVHGDKQVTALLTKDDSTAPKPTTRKFDEKGRLIAIELDPKLRGYPSHITTFAYDAKGNRSKQTLDSDGDGTVDKTWTYTFDVHGNELGALIVTTPGSDASLKHSYGCW